MDPIQVVLLGGSCVTVATGLVKSVWKRPKGEILEQVVVEEEFAKCAVCHAEADEYDDQKMRWVCNQHVSVQPSRPPVRQAQRPQKQKKLPPLQKTQTQRPRTYIEPHDMQTVRDERMLRQAQSRQNFYEENEDDYEEDDEGLCTHGRYPERCRACHQIEQDRNARSVQRRPAQQSLPVRQPRRVEAPDPLEVVLRIVQKYPRIDEEQLADMLEAYPEDVRPFLAAAREELGIVVRRSVQKEREYR